MSEDGWSDNPQITNNKAPAEPSAGFGSGASGFGSANGSVAFGGSGRGAASFGLNKSTGFGSGASGFNSNTASFGSGNGGCGAVQGNGGGSRAGFGSNIPSGFGSNVISGSGASSSFGSGAPSGFGSSISASFVKNATGFESANEGTISQGSGSASRAGFESSITAGSNTPISFGSKVASGIGSSTTAGFGSSVSGFGAASTNFGTSSGGTVFGAGGGGGSSRACYNCNKEGHQSKDCPEPKKNMLNRQPTGACTKCGQNGHWKSDCPSNEAGGTFGSRFNADANSKHMRCFNCKQEGHRTAECPEPSRGCFNCGEQDHKSNECTQPRKEREPLKCFNCGVEGHHRNECPDPPKPREDGGKPPSTFVPEDDTENDLFEHSISQGLMFDRFFQASASVTTGQNAQPRNFSALVDFRELNLGDRFMKNLKLCHYIQPTPIQRLSMPLIMQGADMVGIAQTGSGKTASYLLPILSKINEWQDFSNSGEIGCHPRAIVIVPTRELAVQVYNETRKYAFGTVLTCKPVYGGTSVAYQKTELQKGATIVAATLGRLKHFVEDGTIILDKVRFFVIDEVDRILEQDGQDIIKGIHDKIQDKQYVQGIMFSATFPPGVQDQAASLLKKEYLVVTIGEIGAANQCIHQDFIKLEQGEKKDKLLEILEINKDDYSLNPNSNIFEKKILIFVSKKGFADTLAAMISHCGIPSTTIHGDRMQNERSEAIKDFIYGKKAIMIATAVMERGLDIKGVDLVINYDLPDDIDQYIHRIGRTGRLGNVGRAISFYIPSNDAKLAEGLVKCLQQSGQVIPQWLADEACNNGGYNTVNGITEGQLEQW